MHTLLIIGMVLNFAALFGTPEMRAVAASIFATAGIAVIVMFFTGIGLGILGFNKLQCSSGDQQACYKYEWQQNLRIEGLTPEQSKQKFVNHPASNVNAGIGRRWSLLREQWLDGEIVTTRELCVVGSHSQSPLEDFNKNCFNQMVITGKHKGQFLAAKEHGEYYSKLETTPEVSTYMQELWNTAVWNNKD